MKKEIFYATSNPGKFEEVKTYTQNHSKTIEIKQFCADIPEIQTMDQSAIAVDKALKAWELIQKPIIVDDAAIYFEKYNKFPGTLSKFVSLGIGFDGLKKLIETGDRAKFLLYFVYMENPTNFKVFEGVCEGSLVRPEKSSGDINLPYDCLFIPDGIDRTYAQIKHTEEGNKYLYRIKALKQFMDWWNLANK